MVRWINPGRASLVILLVFVFAYVVRPQVVKPGIDVLRERGFDVLKGKTAGLITNPTGVTAALEATIDVLSKAPGVRLAALFRGSSLLPRCSGRCSGAIKQVGK